MLDVGRSYNLEVLRDVRIGLYLGRDGEELVLLPRRVVPDDAAIGDMLKVFVYHDAEERLTATTETPLARVGGFATLRVVDVTPHGAFLDWGLEKDLFLPYGEMFTPVEEGDLVVVAVSTGLKGRLVAATKLSPFLDRDTSDAVVGERVPLLVYGFNEHGALVIVDGRWSGMIPDDDIHQRIEIGQTLKGWIFDVRPDNKIEVRIRRPGRAGDVAAMDAILIALEEAGGSLPLHDKSPPSEIRDRLRLSKKAFKRAIGGLYRAREIRLVDGGIELVED